MLIAVDKLEQFGIVSERYFHSWTLLADGIAVLFGAFVYQRSLATCGVQPPCEADKLANKGVHSYGTAILFARTAQFERPVGPRRSTPSLPRTVFNLVATVRSGAPFHLVVLAKLRRTRSAVVSNIGVLFLLPM